MKKQSNSFMVDSTAACAVCGGRNQETIIDLPDLPLTDTYCGTKIPDPYGGLNQSLLYCSECSHAQLLNVVKPNLLYADKYHFRTSMSATARSGTDYFENFLKSLFPGKTYSTILDLGCNDLYLLNKLRPVAKRFVGVDPIWAGNEKSVQDKTIHVFGKCIEEIDVDELSAFSPDLIVCRHTIEHIANPRKILQILFDLANNDAIFFFEFPALEPLVVRHRFDYIFHQHLQYFSLRSFVRLIEECGGHYIKHVWNYHGWGALLVAFRKSRGTNPINCQTNLNVESIKRNYELFRNQFLSAGKVLDSFKGGCIYGYGAAQMLPIISYHLENDLSCLKCVLDDDPVKDGLHYWNLPVKISHPRHFRDIGKSTVFITAIDNVKPILLKLFEVEPKHIIYPLHIL